MDSDDTYRADIQMQGTDVRPTLGLHQMLFWKTGDWDIYDEASSLKVESKGFCERR